jgi:uncharacterized damage-inducible protein DinB
MMEKIFLESVQKRMRAYKKLGEDAMAQLSDGELYYRPNEYSNSVAQVVQHLSGNMRSRWTHFLTEDGEKPWRNRDSEFEEHEGNRDSLLQQWESGWQVFLDTLDNLKEEDLVKIIHIRTEPMAVADAILRQLTHYPYHIGQIIYLAKVIRGESWKSLSIAKGKSEDFNRKMKEGDIG